MTRWLLIGLLACCGCSIAPSRDDLTAGMRERPESFIVVTVRNDHVPASTRAGSTLRGYDSAPAYGPSPYAREAVRALATTYRLREVSGWPIAELGVHCVVFELPDTEAAAGLLARLQHDRRVESVQPLNVFATRNSSYNEPYQDLQSSLATMDIKAAHRWSRGAGVDVAVIDTGADMRHPDLAGRIVEHRNFVDGDAETFARDRHGTAVAGVIAADDDNRIGIVGIAPEARLHLYKACWQTDESGAAACNTFTLAKGLAAAIDARVQIVNLSLAGPADSLLTRLVVRGQERGLIFVGAAPQSSTAEAQFPSGVKNVLTVAASGDTSSLAGTLRAPGVDVFTLAPDGGYHFASGNSLATAGVTGTVALILSRNRAVRADQLARLLADSTADSSTGVNACAALAALLNKMPCTVTATAAE